MPIAERASIGVTKNEWRRDQPQSASGFKALLPATQVHDLGRTEEQHEDAYYCGVGRHGLTAPVANKPRGQYNEGAESHAGTIFPAIVNVENSNACHGILQ